MMPPLYMLHTPLSPSPSAPWVARRPRVRPRRPSRRVTRRGASRRAPTNARPPPLYVSVAHPEATTPLWTRPFFAGICISAPHTDRGRRVDQVEVEARPPAARLEAERRPGGSGRDGLPDPGQLNWGGRPTSPCALGDVGRSSVAPNDTGGKPLGGYHNPRDLLRPISIAPPSPQNARRPQESPLHSSK